MRLEDDSSLKPSIVLMYKIRKKQKLMITALSKIVKLFKNSEIVISQ